MHNSQEQLKIKESIKHAWNSYSKYCFGKDTLLSISHNCENWLGGLGATLIDSLDTLIIVGMNDEVKKCHEWINKSFNPQSSNISISVFETIIRIIGGLLAGHSLTNDSLYLKRASELADILLNAFNENGIPYSKINLSTNVSSTYDWTSDQVILSEIGSFQVEFFYLSYYTNNDIYTKYAQRMMNILDQSNIETRGLYPLFMSLRTNMFQEAKRTKRYSWGALGDSMYEYLLKSWILTNKLDNQFLRMYHESVSAMEQRLLKRIQNNVFITSQYGDQLLNSMDHLSCFIPGLLALGVKLNAVQSPHAERHMQIAEELISTCYKMYQSTVSGLSAEISVFVATEPSIVPGASTEYFLRPEFIESLMIMWRVTKNIKYRQWGWNIYERIEKYCRLDIGYAGLKNVNVPSNGHTTKMESYFIAETLKYLYLLFSPDEVISLEDYVFNTEAHPLHILV